MLIAVLDTETSGFSPAKNSTIEIAISLFDTSLMTEIAFFSSLLPLQEGEESNGAEKVNNIRSDVLKARSVSVIAERQIVYLHQVLSKCDFIIAHNAPFDKRFVEALFEKNGLYPVSVPWVCSFKELIFPKLSNAKLGLLAEAHGIETKDAHRAGGDVRVLTQLLVLLGRESLEEQLSPGSSRCEGAELGSDPKEVSWLFCAEVTYDTRHLAKAAGFYWDSGAKKWLKRLTERERKELAESAAFDISKCQ